LWIVRQVKKGRPIGQIALAQKVSRMTVWNIQQAYQKWGEDGLCDHKPGRLFEPLSPKFYELVKEEWKKQHCGARKLHVILSRRGFGVSLRKISQVMKTENMQKPFPKRQKPRKYKRYEWPISDFMWHTDWHVIKASKLKGKNFISYLDDCSRKIMAYGVFEAINTKNSLLILYKAIGENEVTPFELNSDRGSTFIPSKYDKNGHANSEFQDELAHLGIIFIPSRRRHPQTNGKLEKFHHILDTEFDDRFATIDEFITWYNNERLSEAVDYETPNKQYQKRL